MVIASNSLLSTLHRLSRDQVHQAGQRYTPGIDPEAPNIKVESLITTIENAACGSGAHDRFKRFFEDFSDGWQHAENCSQNRQAIQEEITQAEASLRNLIQRLRTRDLIANEEWTTRLSTIELLLKADISHWRTEESKLTDAERQHPYSGKQSTLLSNISSINRCLAVVRDEIEYCDTPAFKVLSDPLLLITGEWGTGKTHLICDVTVNRIDRGQATLLLLAKNFKGYILKDIVELIDPSTDEENLFDQLQSEAERLGERAIVICEGINEGQRRDWQLVISRLRTLIAHRPSLALIVTCRTPFEEVSLLKIDRDHFHTINHPGFDQQEFDAQAAFFKYYELPLPEVPLLDQEFARPLTLKLICQSLQNLTGKKLSNGFAGIASGQRGMTYVLESFVNRVGKPIEEEFGLKTKGCWILLKGHKGIANKKLAGFASCMAASFRGYVRPSEADRILATNYPDMKPAKRRALLETLRVNGIIEEDIVWYYTEAGTKSRIVYRLPYQRFSDHLIARHLLESFLDVSSREAIERSFACGTPLGRVFRKGSFYRSYAEPGWAQALITEFPERIGKRLPNNQCELFFVLPRSARDLPAYFEPFIEGFFWRAPSTFTEGTRQILNRYLNANQNSWEKVIDALAAVSTKPCHPYGARRLYEFLAKYSMPDRDKKWSEYLRRKYASPTIHRLLIWAQDLNVASMTEPAANELIVLFSLVLTTVVRKDRDLATKALLLLGEKYPAILFAHTLKTLSFNDPYVSERMLAASYGVAMSLTDSEVATDFNLHLGKFAKWLYTKMFAPHARFATHHVLKRDYALGIIELAQRANSVKLPRTASSNMAAPFPQISSTFRRDGSPEKNIKEAIGHAIHMDFGNYTIGRLIPYRANYDEKNPGYVKVRSQIEGRIFDLGYSKDEFDEIDRDIGSRSFRASGENKVDRYGKKYSWIAYFEMWGEREANKQLPEWRLGERCSDCGVDPSFPKLPPEWIPPLPDLFGDLTSTTESWVGGNYTPSWDTLLTVPEINGHKGPWVLLEGFVKGVCEDADREIFTFLRGLFVPPKGIAQIKDEFLTAEYPGNNLIPDGYEEHYLYAGEAGRRSRYARHLLNKNGVYRRQLCNAFRRFVTAGSPLLVAESSIEVNIISSDDEEESEAISFPIRQAPRGRWLPGIRIEVPTISFSWESYHSVHNDFSGFSLPAPSLIQKLNLSSRNREIDFYDSAGKPGMLYRTNGDSWKGNRHNLIYIRADLLKQYLSKTRQSLIWCNWGERDWHRNMDGIHVIENSARTRIYQSYQHIHRSFRQWPIS